MLKGIKDIYWLAGIFEGEGTFLVNTSTYMKVGMTDEDIIARVSELLDQPYTTADLREDWKRMFFVQIAGGKAVQWMMTIYPIMGDRRQTKIKEVLAVWKNDPFMGRGRGFRFSSRTHCKYGHEFTEENTRLHKNGRTGRVCRECARLNGIKWREAHSAVR